MHKYKAKKVDLFHHKGPLPDIEFNSYSAIRKKNISVHKKLHYNIFYNFRYDANRAYYVPDMDTIRSFNIPTENIDSFFNNWRDLLIYFRRRDHHE